MLQFYEGSTFLFKERQKEEQKEKQKKDDGKEADKIANIDNKITNIENKLDQILSTITACSTCSKKINPLTQVEA